MLIYTILQQHPIHKPVPYPPINQNEGGANATALGGGRAHPRGIWGMLPLPWSRQQTAGGRP